MQSVVDMPPPPPSFASPTALDVRTDARTIASPGPLPYCWSAEEVIPRRVSQAPPHSSDVMSSHIMFGCAVPPLAPLGIANVLPTRQGCWGRTFDMSKIDFPVVLWVPTVLSALRTGLLEPGRRYAKSCHRLQEDSAGALLHHVSKGTYHRAVAWYQYTGRIAERENNLRRSRLATPFPTADGSTGGFGKGGGLTAHIRLCCTPAPLAALRTPAHTHDVVHGGVLCRLPPTPQAGWHFIAKQVVPYPNINMASGVLDVCMVLSAVVW